MLALGDPLHDLLLLVGHLQGVRLGVAAVVHQVGQGQHRANQDLLVIFAGVGDGVVVRQHRSGGLRRALLLQVIEPVADFAEQDFRLLRTSGGEFDHGPVELQHVGVGARAVEPVVDRLAACCRLPLKKSRRISRR